MFAKKDTAPAPAPAFTPLAQMEPAVPVQELAQTPAPAPVPPPRPKPVSMLAQGVAIKGDLMAEGELHLDCAVQGDIRVGKLILGPNARIEGALHAQAVEVHGKVAGAITARQVRLYATAVVDGDITAEQLAMESGAQFHGRSLRHQRPAPAQVQPQVRPQPQPAPPTLVRTTAPAPAMAVYPN